MKDFEMTEFDQAYIRRGTLRQPAEQENYVDDLSYFGGWVLAIAAFVALGVWAVLS